MLAAGLTMTSCDYLNVIPDETTTGSDMTKDRQPETTVRRHGYGLPKQ